MKKRIGLYSERVELPVMMPEEITEHIIGHNGELIAYAEGWEEARQWLASHPITWDKVSGMGMCFLDVEMFYAEEENLGEDGEWEPTGCAEIAALKHLTAEEIETEARFRFRDGDIAEAQELASEYLYTQEDAAEIAALMIEMEAEYDDD